MFQTKVVEKIKTHILCSIVFLNRVVYEIKWKNIVQPERPQVTNEFCIIIPKTTNTLRIN